MSILDDPAFIPFLLRAKRATYAASNEIETAEAIHVPSSRPQSHDLSYREGEWAYLDTYLGGFAFTGEEAVWRAGQPVWGMNYYGAMTISGIPEGFSDFLKLALRGVPAEAPYRGPARFEQGCFAYLCRWQGDPERFTGDESITLDGQVIYTLSFHGGVISS